MLVEFKNFQLCLVPIKCKGRKIENKKSQEKYKIKLKLINYFYRLLQIYLIYFSFFI